MVLEFSIILTSAIATRVAIFWDLWSAHFESKPDLK